MQITDLKKWDCYFAPYPKGKYHRIIIININYDTGGLLCLTIQSNEFRPLVKYSVVQIPQHFWKNELTNNFSFVVCEKASMLLINADEFIELLNKGKITKKIIPDIIIRDIKKGIQLSATFTDYDKTNILNN